MPHLHLTTRRASQSLIGITLLLSTAACDGIFKAVEYEALEVTAFALPDTVVAGRTFLVDVDVEHSPCNERIRVVPRTQGDAMVLMGEAERYDEICIASAVISTVRSSVRAPHRGPLIVRAYRRDGFPGTVDTDTIVVLPAP